MNEYLPPKENLRCNSDLSDLEELPSLSPPIWENTIERRTSGPYEALARRCSHVHTANGNYQSLVLCISNVLTKFWVLQIVSLF